jgi:hypothetical protein
MAAIAATRKKATRKAPRSQAKPKTQASVNLRLPQHMLERADALLPHAARAPELATAPSVTRSDVLRLAILRGLQVLDDEYEAIVDEELAREAYRRLTDPTNQERIPLEEVLGRHGL